MNKFLFALAALTAAFTTFCRADSFTFAWLSDIHLNSFAYAREDFKEAIEEINNNPDVDFAVISGDLTEFGDTKEFLMLDTLLKALHKPCLMTTGNHDVNWSENGCTAFEKIFGSPHFVYDVGEYRLIGCGAGPPLRMGPPQIPREELVWLDSAIKSTPSGKSIIFINHFPLDSTLSNGRELYRLLDKADVKVILSGHLHINRTYSGGGIPGVIGRSTLRRSDPEGGYNLVTLKNDTLFFRERLIKRETKDVWATVAMKAERKMGNFKNPDYSINGLYPQVRELWRREENSDIASQGSLGGNTYLYTTTAGVVYALDSSTGEELWSYKGGNKIFSTPYIAEGKVIITSCDGNIYALRLKDGKLLWSYNTGYPIVASPVVAEGSVYTGSGNGRFRSLRLKNGELQWECDSLTGYIEARPAVDAERVFIGTWGAKFYAIRRCDGKRLWEFDTGKGRYFSPGACWPEVTHFIGPDGRKEQVIVLSSDNYLRAFDPVSGEILWASNEAKGRESTGFSPDKKKLYIKGIEGSLTAVDISGGRYNRLWSLQMPYKSDFVPTRIESTGELLYIPTEFGTVYAVKSDGSAIVWSHKVAHSAVTSLQKVGNDRLIVATMDGTVVCLETKF